MSLVFPSPLVIRILDGRAAPFVATAGVIRTICVGVTETILNAGALLASTKLTVDPEKFWPVMVRVWPPKSGPEDLSTEVKNGFCPTNVTMADSVSESPPGAVMTIEALPDGVGFVVSVMDWPSAAITKSVAA